MDHGQKLRKLLEQIASEQGYKNYKLTVTPISSGGANYSSLLYTAKIEENGKNDVNLFSKVGITGEEIREILDIKVFYMEQYVYTKMNAIFRELEDKNNVAEEDRFLLPKYYGSSTVPKEEVLVLEDLTVKGFTMYDRHKSVDWAYASGAVKELAKYHALAMALKKQHPQEYEKICRDLFSDWITEDTYNTYYNNSFKKVLETVREENREKLKKFFDTVDIHMLLNLLGPCRKAVIIHSDYRISNLMHRCREDGSVQVIPLDYQVMRPGSVVIDLVYFIITSTDAEFRRIHYSHLIEHYYTQLSAAMDRLGVENSYYSRDDFEYELNEKLPYGLTVAAFQLRLALVESEDAPKVEAGLEMDAMSEFKSSSIYSERLNGIVDDYVRWGVLK